MIKRINKALRVLLLLVLLIASVSTLTIHRCSVSSASEVSSTYQSAITELDSMGRLPLTGEVSGEINNAYQFVKHPGHADHMGCGDQASFVYTKLAHIPGWSFKIRYEYGFSSPILLPHQWIEGHGPEGQIAEIDPWADRIVIN